jgi:hypothetical protein
MNSGRMLPTSQNFFKVKTGLFDFNLLSPKTLILKTCKLQISLIKVMDLHYHKSQKNANLSDQLVG